MEKTRINDPRDAADIDGKPKNDHEEDERPEDERTHEGHIPADERESRHPIREGQNAP